VWSGEPLRALLARFLTASVKFSDPVKIKDRWRTPTRRSPQEPGPNPGLVFLL